MVDRDEARKSCEQHGIHWAKAWLTGLSAANNTHAMWVSEWIHEKESAAAAELDAKTLALAERNTKAAEESAIAVRDSVAAARSSARAAYFAGLIALFAFTLSVVAFFDSKKVIDHPPKKAEAAPRH